MYLPDGPILIKFIDTIDANFSKNFVMSLKEELSLAYEKKVEITHFDQDGLDKFNSNHILLLIKHNDITDSWNLKTFYTKIPNFRLILSSCNLFELDRKHSIETPISNALLKSGLFNICIGFKKEPFAKRILPFFSSTTVMGKKSWVYIFEKIRSLSILSKAFEHDQFNNENDFDVNETFYSAITAILDNQIGSSLVTILQKKEPISRLFAECDPLVLNDIGERQLNKLLKPYGLTVNEWMQCKPGEGVYWRNS